MKGRQPNNYDAVAGMYDRLSRMVFGKALIRSQTYLLPFISPGSSLLIAGGGTGWILEEIGKIYSSSLSITYVELSAKMLSLAEKRDCKDNNVVFVHKAIEDFTAGKTYDIVITPFLFDNFHPQRLPVIFSHLSVMLKPGGRWLFADFHFNPRRTPFWQKLLLQTMLFFFRALCHIEARQMNNMSPYFRQYSYAEKSSKYFFGEFIRAVVYEKR